MNYREAIQQARDLDTLAEKVRSTANDKVEQSMQVLSSGWKGNNASEFLRKYGQLKQQILDSDFSDVVTDLIVFITLDYSGPINHYGWVYRKGFTEIQHFQSHFIRYGIFEQISVFLVTVYRSAIAAQGIFDKWKMLYGSRKFPVGSPG